jgi:hypothetical protein
MRVKQSQPKIAAWFVPQQKSSIGGMSNALRTILGATLLTAAVAGVCAPPVPTNTTVYDDDLWG